MSDRLGRQGRFARWTRLVAQQAFDTLFSKPLLPAPHRRSAYARSPGDLLHGQALIRVEDDARPLHVLLRAVAVGDDRGEALPITGCQHHT